MKSEKFSAQIKQKTRPFIAILRWFLISALVGIITGFIVFLFIYVLNYVVKLTRSSINNYFFFLPLALFLSGLIQKHIIKTTKGYGTDELIDAIHHKNWKIHLNRIPARAVATIITISFGGSAGKWGPAVKSAVGTIISISKVAKLKSEDVKKVIICSISGGFAAIFGTPVAGAIFGVEVLYVGSIMYDVIFPSLVSGMFSYQTARYLGIQHLKLHALKQVVSLERMSMETLLGGIFFGLVAIAMVKFLEWSSKVSSKLKMWHPLKGIIGGVAILVLTMGNPQFAGAGISTINDALVGESVEWYAFLMKIVITGITLNFGGTGGVMLPMFFIGTTAGNTFAQLFNLDRQVFSAIGMVSVLAGAANTPISASIMAVEIFGPSIAPFAAISCIISFLITGYRGIFPTQVIVATKLSENKHQSEKGKNED